MSMANQDNLSLFDFDEVATSHGKAINGANGFPILLENIVRRGKKKLPIGDSGKPLINISFSGGLSSAYMTDHLLQNYSDTYEFIVTFANTGLELEQTLEFVKKCDDEKGFNTIWLEAVISPDRGVGTIHKIVDFETATRSPILYETMASKYGIPNLIYRHCTRELKVNVMNSYLRSLGYVPSHIPTAIGIREDESKRCTNKPEEQNLIYPMVNDFPVNKDFVRNYWNVEQPFTLELEEHQGNCLLCFEKCDSKLYKQIEENPDAIQIFIDLEKKYGHINNKPDKPNRVFYRKNRSAQDMLNNYNELKSKSVQESILAA